MTWKQLSANEKMITIASFTTYRTHKNKNKLIESTALRYKECLSSTT